MSSAAAANGDTVETKVPARLDRLPWSKFHWLVVIGLGTVWILDGLEVTIVGSIGDRLTEGGSGIAIDASQIGTAAAFYVGGACVGALFFGQLTDRFGRKNLFLVTLGLYIAATVVTAFSTTALMFFVCRFFTGAGIGGEYAAINSAIDELIPARVRGRVDLIINGSYWLGAAGGALVTVALLDTSFFAQDLGWRLAFGLGALLGVGILIVRRNVPESPRWLFIHGREDEAEQIVGEIEAEVRESNGEELAEVGDDETLTVHQRKTIPFREIAHSAISTYPRRTALGLALFVGQAFLYNAVTFDLGTLLGEFFKVDSGTVPLYLAVFGISNFLGPLTLGRLFDTVGRKPMVAGTYLAAAVLTLALGLVLLSTTPSTLVFMAFVLAIFFFASSGASSAYLTVSEIFPMESRALSIAFFYAIGTAAGGIVGPLLFGHLIASGSLDNVAWGFLIGAVVMAVGGIAEIFFGVEAEQQQLEDVAEPLSAEGGGDGEGSEGSSGEEEREAPAPPARPQPATRQPHWSGRGLSAGGGPYVEVPLDAEVAAIARALEEHGSANRRELRLRVRARTWGPGRFSAALREAIREGKATRLPRGQIAPGHRG
jgi:MFS family permease